MQRFSKRNDVLVEDPSTKELAIMEEWLAKLERSVRAGCLLSGARRALESSGAAPAVEDARGGGGDDGGKERACISPGKEGRQPQQGRSVHGWPGWPGWLLPLPSQGCPKKGNQLAPAPNRLPWAGSACPSAFQGGPAAPRCALRLPCGGPATAFWWVQVGSSEPRDGKVRMAALAPSRLQPPGMASRGCSYLTEDLCRRHALHWTALMCTVSVDRSLTKASIKPPGSDIHGLPPRPGFAHGRRPHLCALHITSTRAAMPCWQASHR